MSDLPIPRTEIRSRLKKIEGQVRGIHDMVEQERQCIDIMVQLAAVKGALETVAGLVLRNYASICTEAPETRILTPAPSWPEPLQYGSGAKASTY